ncbi:MAG: hypothetical protein ACI89J_002176 [Hyphomicrobiaceae bacterium]|jgi:hypothetical protein
MNAHSMRRFYGLSTARVPRAGPCEKSVIFTWLDRILGPIGKIIGYGIVRFFAVLCLMGITLTAVQAKGRVALLLGAEKYQHFKASKVTVAQNQALEKALRDQGFDVVLAANPGNAAARAALSEFSRKATSADFALIVASGHFATYRRQSFFLPTNARVRRATDLFSRGLSVANIADIAHRAKSGALLLLTTVPDIPSTVAGVGVQPGFATEPPDNIVAVFSTSTKVPVSRVDSVSAQAMKDVIEVASEKPMMLAALVDGASAGGTGRIIGKINESNLSEDLTKSEVPKVASSNDADRKARELAETRLNQAVERAQEAEKRAREAEANARRELAAAALEADRKADAAKSTAEAKAKRELAAAMSAAARKAAAERKLAEVNSAPKQPLPDSSKTTAPPVNVANIQSLQVVEALLGRQQRKVIQGILKAKGFYEGPIDAIFGDQTRVAIRDFQRASGASETGYLTPAQFQQLVADR